MAATPAERPDARLIAHAVDVLLGIEPLSPARPPHRQFAAGVTLASVGAASLLTSYALYAVRSTRQADAMVALPSNDNQATWINTRTGMFLTGAAGSVALVSAMPLALPYRAKTPWWAWLSGGVGLALVATSISLAATAPGYPDVSRVADPQGYVARDKRTDGAFLSGVTAAPLLTIPMVYLLRRAEGRGRAELTPSVLAGRNGGYLGLRGTY